MRIGRRDNPIFEMDSVMFTVLVVMVVGLVAIATESYFKAKYGNNVNVKQQQTQGGVGENPPNK